jgi:hypothetical protein
MSEPTAHDYAVRIAVLETKLTATDEARKLQAVEYERRLAELNHAHSRTREDRAGLVTRELHDALERELRTSIVTTSQAVDKRINELSSKVYMGIGIVLTAQFVIGAIVLYLLKR